MSRGVRSGAGISRPQHCHRAALHRPAPFRRRRVRAHRGRLPRTPDRPRLLRPPEHVRYAVRTDRPIVHDAHNVEYRIVAAPCARSSGSIPGASSTSAEWRRLRAYESAMYRRSALVFAVSDIDAPRHRRASPAAGVPIVRRCRSRWTSPASRRSAELTDDPHVLFLGTLDWPPNGDAVSFFLQDVWPRVRREAPAARFTVVGRGETALRRRWASAPGVTFTGWVPDIEPWIRQSRLMVVPIAIRQRHAGQDLDAFARGLPVVATPSASRESTSSTASTCWSPTPPPISPCRAARARRRRRRPGPGGQWPAPRPGALRRAGHRAACRRGRCAGKSAPAVNIVRVVPTKTCRVGYSVGS